MHVHEYEGTRSMTGYPAKNSMMLSANKLHGAGGKEKTVQTFEIQDSKSKLLTRHYNAIVVKAWPHFEYLQLDAAICGN